MKRLALVAAMFVVAACAKNDQAKQDSAAAAAAPAPAPAAAPAAAPADTGMKMSDSAHKADSVKAADSAKAASKMGKKGATKGATKKP
ncbi:MAG TPA: hypothetical protein VJN70_18095 [Gemmatimonadaceae bacterium]|nr:hypothetical protein [Gemmatimonadaceae bacterium]